jgi:hypothetical protein
MRGWLFQKQGFHTLLYGTFNSRSELLIREGMQT